MFLIELNRYCLTLAQDVSDEVKVVFVTFIFVSAVNNYYENLNIGSGERKGTRL